MSQSTEFESRHPGESGNLQIGRFSKSAAARRRCFLLSALKGPPGSALQPTDWETGPVPATS